MLAVTWFMLSTMLYSLQLNTGSFPKPLTEEEERTYLERSKAGDLEARNILIERNMRLVAHIMKKYYAQNSDQEDLISIGTIGLIKGITTFDPDKGARLATYAARCVENATLSPATLRASSLHPKAAPDWRILDRISAEVAKLAGVTRAVYIDIACGITQHIPLEMVQ